jgi:hypothetical protein
MNARSWKRLRSCLGISQGEMGRLLCMSQDRISLIESGKLEPQPRTMEMLKLLLQDPRIRQCLEEESYPHPWPGEGEPDLVTLVFGARSGHCRSCGIVLSPATTDAQDGSRLCRSCRQELAQEERRN